MLRQGLLVIALLSGCAITPDKANKMSNFDLCDIGHSYLSSEETLRNTHAEIRRRDLDCENYRESIMAARGAAIDGISKTLEQPAQSSPEKPVTCNTLKRHDGSFRTFCQ